MDELIEKVKNEQEETKIIELQKELENVIDDNNKTKEE